MRFLDSEEEEEEVDSAVEELDQAISAINRVAWGTEEPHVQLPRAFFQNAVIHQLKNMSSLLDKMNKQIVSHSFTMAH